MREGDQMKKLLGFLGEYWLEIAFAALLGVAMLSAGVERTRRLKVQAEFSEFKATAAENARQAEAREREKEQQWSEKVTEVSTHAQGQINALQADLVSSRTASERLHRAAAAAAKRAASQTPAVASAGPSVGSADPLDLLVGVLQRHSDELVEVGGYADKLRIAGLACERADEVTR